MHTAARNATVVGRCVCLYAQGPNATAGRHAPRLIEFGLGERESA